MKTREISQMKPRLGQGRVGLRHKIKTLIPINKPIAQTMKSPPNDFTPKSPKAQDTVIPSCTVPQMKPRGDISSRKTIQYMSREIPIYPDPIYWPPPKPGKTRIPEIPGNLSDIDPEPSMDFKDNSPFQEGVISETYQRPDRSYFQEPQELESLINTGRLVQKFLLKQADINKY